VGHKNKKVSYKKTKEKVFTLIRVGKPKNKKTQKWLSTLMMIGKMNELSQKIYLHDKDVTYLHLEIEYKGKNHTFVLGEKSK